MHVRHEHMNTLIKCRAYVHYITYLCRGGGSNEVRLVCHLNVPGAGVGLRVDGDGGDPEALGGGHDAAGDLAAVGDQQLSKCNEQPPDIIRI